jgi:hypothetical protein
MKLQDVILEAMAKKISWLAAAEIAGMSDRTMRHQGLVRALVVDAVPAVPLVQPGKDLVRFVDHGEIELGRGAERRRAALAAREFPADQIDAEREEIRLVLSRLNAEEIQKFVLPLPNERLRHDQQDALRAFRAALRDNQSGLDRLSQANLVGQNATAFAQTPERENYRVDLVRVGINARLALGCGIALTLIRPAYTDQVFGENPLVERVHI